MVDISVRSFPSPYFGLADCLADVGNGQYEPHAGGLGAPQQHYGATSHA